MALAPYSRQKRKASHHYLTVILVIVLVLVAALVGRFFYSEVVQPAEASKDYLFEPNAVTLEENSRRDGQDNPSPVPEGSISYQINTQMTYQTRKEELDLMAANPAENPYYLRVRLIGEDEAPIFESGMLKPGTVLETISLTDMPQEGTYPVMIEFEAYDIATLELLGTVQCAAEIRVI